MDKRISSLEKDISPVLQLRWEELPGGRHVGLLETLSQPPAKNDHYWRDPDQTDSW